jgi:hypothetical protein
MPRLAAFATREQAQASLWQNRPIRSSPFFLSDGFNFALSLFRPALLFVAVFLFQLSHTVKDCCGTVIARLLDCVPVLPLRDKS